MLQNIKSLTGQFYYNKSDKVLEIKNNIVINMKVAYFGIYLEYFAEKNISALKCRPVYNIFKKVSLDSMKIQI